MSALNEPRLGIYRDGDGVSEKTRQELLRLPEAKDWTFATAGESYSLDMRVYTLVYIGDSRSKNAIFQVVEQ